MNLGRAVAAILCGSLASGLVLAVTEPPAPGIDPDAMSYLGAAESLARAGTLRIPVARWSSPDSTSPLAHFPPGLPAALTVPIRLGATPLDAARFLQAGAAATSVGIVVWVVGSTSGLAAGVLGGGLLLLTPSVLEVHRRVLSEPLFLSLMVLTIALLVRNRWRRAALAAAAAGMVRYAGVSLSAAVALWAIARASTRQERVRGGALALLPALAAQGLWAARVAHEGWSIRVLGIHGDLEGLPWEASTTLVHWLAPSVAHPVLGGLLALAILGACAALLLRAWRRCGGGNPVTGVHAVPLLRLLQALGLCAGCYLAVLSVSRLFADRGLPFDWRLLAPLMVMAEIGLVAALGAAWSRWTRGWRALATLIVAAWVLGALRADLQRLEMSREGVNYANVAWQRSGLVRWIRTDGRRHELFTNNPVAVYVLAGRPSRELPRSLEPGTVATFGATLRRRRGVLIAFEHPFTSTAAPAELARRLSLRELARYEDGTVWRAP